MSIFIDLIQSLFIRGSMIAVMMTLTVSMNDALYQKMNQANTKAHVGIVGDMLYTDLTQAGYNAPTPAFLTASESDIKFQGDLDNDSTSETIRYYTALDANTGLYKLYRTVNGGTPLPVGKKFNSVTFQYYNVKGKITSTLSEIAAVRVNVVEGIEGTTTGGFTTASMNFKIYPSNL